MDTIFKLELQQLIRRCIDGQPIAQKAFYERYSTSMFRLCFRYLKQQEDAEDVLVRGFTKAFRALSKLDYQGEGALIAWLKKIMVNEALMVLRSRNLWLHALAEPPEQEEAPKVESDLAAEELYSLIRQLPDGYRTVFNLYVIEGHTHPEIAALLGISPNTSKTQLNKARKALRHQLRQTSSIL
ncbi:MAG: RNA polymerase sigma factor [Salibacteraceae bacterium]